MDQDPLKMDKSADPVRKRKGQPGDEPSPLRVRLPDAVGSQVRAALSELKRRGVSVSTEELLETYLVRLKDSYFESEIERRTPERYYLEVAMEKPEVLEKLIRQARKALGKLSERSPVAVKRKKKDVEQSLQATPLTPGA